MTTGNSTWRTHAALLLVGAVLVVIGLLVKSSADFVGALLVFVGVIALIGGTLNLVQDARDADRT